MSVDYVDNDTTRGVQINAYADGDLDKWVVTFWMPRSKREECMSEIMAGVENEDLRFVFRSPENKNWSCKHNIMFTTAQLDVGVDADEGSQPD